MTPTRCESLCTILRRCPRAAAVVALGWWSALLLPSAAEPADPAISVLKTKIGAVSLFKNGMGFVSREAILPKGQGPWLIEDLPAPAHGTFWVHAEGRDALVRDLVAFQKESVERVEASNLPELLEANVGESVELRLGEKDSIGGKILGMPQGRAGESSAAEANRMASAYYGLPSAETPALVLLEISGGGTVAVHSSAVQQVTSERRPLKTTIERKRRSTALRLSVTKPAAGTRIVVQYLAKGITWAPSSAIDITDPQKARITAKAEIIDEIEDLDDVSVSFVTGFPNLQFADVTDPLAMRGDLAAFLSNLANPAAAAQFHGGAAMQQAVMMNVADNEFARSFPVFPSASQEGQTREELFFYEQRGVTLKKGERGYYPLFTAEVPYEHVYEWKIGDTLDETDRYGNRDQNGVEKAEDVWHSVRLTNTGSVPWTTAPAMTMQGGRILGQDLIRYTSVGAKTTVRITKAIDIKAEQGEHEVDRKRGAANFYGSNYDLVEVRGSLKAMNFKDKRVTLTISKELSGEVVKTEPAARVEQTARGVRKVNPKSLVTWEVPVAPRDKIEIEYSYRVFVRE